MTRSIRSLMLAALAIGGLSWGVALSVRAAEQPSAPPSSIGVIDMEKVANEGDAVKNGWAQINSLLDSLLKALEENESYQYLTSAETKELGAILEAREQTPAQKGRYEELKKAAADREKEYAQLAVIKDADLKPEQKKRLEELAQARNSRAKALQEVRDGYQKKIEEKQAELLPKMSKAVEDAIDAVAKEQKLSIVLSKKVAQLPNRPADDVVLWGGKDITAEVIKRMNKK